MDSILNSIKKMLGIESDYTAFDTEIIVHINSVFATLEQICPLVPKSFSITDDSTVWSAYIQDKTWITFIKSYMYMKVRILFDPPSGAVLTAFNEAIKESEWRLSIADNLGGETDEENEPEQEP